MKARSILRLALLLVAIALSAIDGRADSVTLNLSTSLLNGTTFSAGTTYYAVFQLVGGGTDNNIATLSNFSFTAEASWRGICRIQPRVTSLPVPTLRMSPAWDKAIQRCNSPSARVMLLVSTRKGLSPAPLFHLIFS